MKIRIISVGKIRESFYVAGVQEYLKRLRPYAGIDLLEGLDEKFSPKAGDEDIKRLLAKEAERILSIIKPDELLVVLDIQGEKLASEQLARHFLQWQQSGKARLNFVVGSSLGLSDIVKKRADFHLSFSDLTFPHQMAVLILTEQIYRSYKIIKGEPYHH